MKKGTKKVDLAKIIVESIVKNLPHICIIDKETKFQYTVAFRTTRKGLIKSVYGIKQKI